MLQYMLDTDSVSFALRGEGNVGVRLLERRPSEVCISAITLAELRYGAALRRSKRLHGLIQAFTSDVLVAAFDAPAADRYGDLASALAQKGTPIGAYDTLIAAHALAMGLTLVTNNTRHFERVSGLKTQNWAR
jgi:tRNA(fMet)-specific endonuclease VapC